MENEMFCYQCQETAGCKGCTRGGVCGKTAETARMQDLLIYATKGLAAVAECIRDEGGSVPQEIHRMVTRNLFATITNANFDCEAIEKRVEKTLAAKEKLRVLDAGQCNDSYSLALTALKLKEAFGLSDINQLPIVYNIAWYEQKAVIVLLALLHLGVKNIHLGPTLPAFLSENVAKVLVEKFGIGGITNVADDIRSMIG